MNSGNIQHPMNGLESEVRGQKTEVNGLGWFLRLLSFFAAIKSAIGNGLEPRDLGCYGIRL